MDFTTLKGLAIPILPPGYTQVEYIESTGTQYIDTLYSAPDGFIFDCEFSWINIGGSYIVGSYNSSSPYGRNGVGLAGGQNFWELGTGNIPVQASGHTVTLGTKYKVQGSTVKGNSYLDIDGTRIITSSDSADRYPETLLVFYIHYGKHFGDKTALGKLYYLKISDPNGVLVRHFVPCKNASGEAGLYDLVEGKFYTNAGSGTFSVGADYQFAVTQIADASGRVLWSAGPSVATVILRPTADLPKLNNMPHSVYPNGSSLFACIDEEVADDDSTYIYGTSNSSLFTLTGTIPDGMRVTAAKVVFVGKYDDASYNATYSVSWINTQGDGTVSDNTIPDTTAMIQGICANYTQFTVDWTATAIDLLNNLGRGNISVPVSVMTTGMNTANKSAYVRLTQFYVELTCEG